MQLHAYEHAAASRPTDDIDLLSDTRKKATQRIAKTLDRLGELATPPAADPRLGYQWEVDGQLGDGTTNSSATPVTVSQFP